MFFDPRLSVRDLASLCRRLANATESGIDIRRIWEREAQHRGGWGQRARFEEIRDHVARGNTLHDAVESTGDFFPLLFREMLFVGEQTGKLPHVFLHLAEHYEHQIRTRQLFLARITWPMIQLLSAVCVIGLLIWVLGMIPPGPRGERIDILGWGLIGERGVLIYFSIIGAVVFGLWLVYRAMVRGMLWTRPLQYALMRLPVVGQALRTLALGRVAWSMSLTFGAGMDLLRAVPLALRGSGSAYYTDHVPELLRNIRAGREVTESLRETGAFSPDFLDTVEVGERSGRLPETLDILSRQYQEQGQLAVATLTMVAGFLVWAGVAAVIILMIFRLFSFYMGMLEEATRI